MSPIVILALAILAAAMQIVCLLTLMFAFGVDSLMLAVQVSKLVKSANLDRAIKLCKAAEGYPVARGFLGVLETCAKSNVRDQSMLREVYDADLKGALAGVAKAKILSYAGLAVLVAAIGLQSFFGVRLPFYVWAILAATPIAFALSMVTGRGKEQQATQALAMVIAALQEAK